jgi:uncharacterized glyoxalase superfamily protein PhnB
LPAIRAKIQDKKPFAALIRTKVRTKEDVVFIRGMQPMTDWFGRPVLHVRDVEASLRFYVDRLGFTSPWRHGEDGRTHVAQVERQGCALILADSWPEKIGKGLTFISVNAGRETQIAELDALRSELAEKGAPPKDGSWGYRLLVVDDPDGNQLFFNYPNETASGVSG